MTDKITANSASQPFIKAASVNVTQYRGNVTARVAFSNEPDYLRAQEILKKQQGWDIGDEKLPDSTRYKLHVLVTNASVPAVADRLREIGISTIAAAPAPTQL